jgi:hypothetical protein
VVDARRRERRDARAPKVAEQAVRRSQLDSLPTFTNDTRMAALIGTIGLVVPLGLGLVAGWFALRARRTLTAHEIGRSPGLLRYAAVVSTIGAAFSITVVAAVPVTLTAPTDEPPGYAGGLYLTIWLVVGVAALLAWRRAAGRGSLFSLD